MRTVLYTGIHQKNNELLHGNIIGKINYFPSCLRKVRYRILLISVKVLMLLICLQQVNMMDRG